MTPLIRNTKRVRIGVREDHGGRKGIDLEGGRVVPQDGADGEGEGGEVALV